MAGRRTSTQEMMARLEVIEEEDTVTRSSVEGVHNKTSASTKATLAKINETLQEMQQAEAGANRPDGRGRGNAAANHPLRQPGGTKL